MLAQHSARQIIDIDSDVDVHIRILVILIQPIHRTEETCRRCVLKPSVVLLVGLETEVKCFDDVLVDTNKIVAANL